MAPNFDWAASKIKAKRVLKQLLEQKHSRSPATFNVNFPDVASNQAATVEICECRLDRKPLPVAYKQLDANKYLSNPTYNSRERMEGFDVSLCFGGKVTVTGFDFVTPEEAAERQ